MSHSDPSPPGSPRLLDRWTQRVRRSILALPALPFFVGIALGFGACAVAGRIVSRQPMFENFVRFFSPIQPQRYFYPTASQLVAHVRHTVKPDQTLVLIGGASYFRGTGQNPRELWSLELQRQLGPRYAVVNFAIDQADITAFSAVVFEVLAREYPTMIYVANGNTTSAAPVDGGGDYRYLFWDAYYKGLLPPSVAGSPAVRDLRRAELRDPAALEVHLGQWLDQFAYACDLWTYLGYTRFFTVWADEHRFSPFRPRHLEHEGDDPDIAVSQANIRKDAAYIQHSETFAKNASRNGHVRTPGGKWEVDTLAWSRLGDEFRMMFPAELRPRCFVVLLRANPFFMQTLTDEERGRTETIYRLAQQAYEREGYQVVQLHAQDFTADDYLDGGHLVASGGYKVAKAVTARLEEIDRATHRSAAATQGGQAGPVEIKFSLPADRTPRQETLLSVTSANGTEQLLLDYLDGNRVRFVHRSGEPARTVASPPVELPSGASHTVLASLSGLYPRTAADTGGQLTADELAGLKTWFLLQLDGQPFWEFPLDAVDRLPGEILVGKNPATATSPTAFTGQIHATTRLATPPKLLHRDQVGGARLRLTLTEAMAGRSFPLATTGKSGEGDVLFLHVTAGGQAVFGYDHWGRPSLSSPEIPLGWATPHLVEFRLPALADPGSVSEVVVTVDGKLLWQEKIPAYRADPAHIYFGKNPIGATSSEPALPDPAFEAVLTPAWRG